MGNKKAKAAIFELLHSQKLISHKIWMIEKSRNFHTVILFCKIASHFVGFRCHYVPGWDCHGLPIELKALSKAKSREKDALKIRQISRNFALEAIEQQMREFVSWGVIGDWGQPYQTMKKDFVIHQLRLFHKMIKEDFVYRRYMPVYWSPSSRTALAESELEYNPNVSGLT